VIPVPQCVKILKKAGYDGYLSLEFEGWEENIPALESGFAFLKSIV
jgi:sugar phosphate isomerase/epimerase